MEDPGRSGWDGERLSFDEAYRRHAPEIYRYCNRLARSHVEAEDLAQETWIQVWRSLDKFEGRSPLKRWIYRIAFRKWMARRVNVDLPVTELDEGREPAVDPTGPVDTRVVLEQALRKLSEPMRVAVILVKSEGLTHEEAAAIVGISPGAMRFRVFKALHQLRSVMAESGVVLGMFSLGALDRPLREWGDVGPPTGLRDRVFSAAQGVPGGGPAVIRARPRGRAGLRWLLAGFVGGLLALGVLTWLLVFAQPAGKGGPTGAAAARARQLLTGLAGVRKAMAQGQIETYDRNGEHVQQLERVRYWFLGPGSYRMERSGGSGSTAVRTELVVTGEKGMLTIGSGARAPRKMEATAQEVRAQMAPFTLFEESGGVAEALRRRDTDVVEVATDQGDAEGRLLQVTGHRANFREKWLLTIEPTSGRPRRVELTRESVSPTGWHRNQRVILDRFVWGD